MNLRFGFVFKLLLCGLILVNSSCRNDVDWRGDVGNTSTVSLICDKPMAWSDVRSGSSRALIDEKGNGNFVSGDCIDVLVSGSDLSASTKMEFDGSQWNPSLKRSDYGNGNLEVSALFPVLSKVNDSERSISIPVDQSIETNYTMADVLYGQTSVSENVSSSKLQFKHALHRICINLKGEIPDDLQLEVRSRIEGNISLKSGGVSLNGEDVYTWIKPFRKDADTYMAIILPQDVSPYHDGEGFIRITSKEKISVYKLDKNIKSFSSGIQTTLNLTLKVSESGGEVDADFSNQKLWVYGINSPVFPGKDNIKSYPITTWITDYADGEWFRHDYSNSYPPLPNEEEFLTWIEGCGWYDCNKTFNLESDGYMCWAATASNLLHWWLDRNKNYVDAYYARYGGERCPMKYQRMTEENQNHSEIFNFFKDCFYDLGSWDTGGVNWFINGDNTNLSYNSNVGFKGFFHELFSKKDPIATENRNTSKENFNKCIKDAFLNNKAIGFSVYGFNGPGSKQHSMTIWGAEFDAEGNVSNLYFCDNNYGETEPNHASLKRFKIVYDDSDIQGSYLVPLDNNDGTQSKAKAIICSVTLVDLRRDIWRKEFPEVNN